MKTQTRLIVLLGLLTAVFLACVLLLRLSQQSETEEKLREERAERSDLLDRLIELNGESLQSFARDYSNWGEMMDFVKKATPQWAEVNIDASLANFHADAAWVICPQGKQIYGTVHGLDPALRTLPVPVTELLPEFKKSHFAHFFVKTPHGLLEMRVGPIQPSEDIERTSEPQGWFIVGRAWDEKHRKQLSGLLHAEVKFDAVGQILAPLTRDEIELTRTLRDWRGRPVQTLRARYVVRGLENIEVQNDYEMLLLLGFGLTVIIAGTIAVSRWIVTPLRRIEDSLSASAPHNLKDMEAQPDVFGRLAKLVRASTEHRSNLEREVEERRRAEVALSQSREELHRSSEMKTRLARDLHDGVIQSIYATGLGLESAKSTLASDPGAARTKLDAAQAALNQTIREVRSFIQGLEPEQASTQEFAHELRTLVATLRSLHSADIQTRIEADPATLSPREEVHALQIVRECVSNAIRHGDAQRIDIEFIVERLRPTLRIRDDGKGFDAALARRGSGLVNVAARSAEIGAELELASSPGKGTDIVIRFSQRKPTS